MLRSPCRSTIDMRTLTAEIKDITYRREPTHIFKSNIIIELMY